MFFFSKPEVLLKNIISYAAVLIFLIFATTVLWTQSRYWYDVWFGSGDYADQQRAHHHFICRPQVGRETPELVDTNQIRHRYFALMEVTRQEAAPTDFVGKFQKFVLCADFSRIGVGSVVLAETGSGSFFFDEMHVDEAQIRQGEYAAILARYPHIEDYLADEVMCLLRHIALGKSVLEPDMCPASEVGSPLIPEPDIEPQPLPPETSDPGPWILISGADQTNQAALTEVRAARTVLGGATGVGATEVFLIRSWRRTVTYFDSEEHAKKALNDNKSRLRFGGYIRNTVEWCDGLPTDVEDTLEGVRFLRCHH
ncbi:hypothetical protein [uncultured Roseobacter sp.]|uniref:hypothetical protein n=1 Tax=uncultured Roseobacter sp. TaxID=114847 RepID=UPI002637CD21|nr:hypothetical protein [uncultured Roseobacter sp.]